MDCIEVIDENYEVRHLPSIVNTYLTLCGFVDVTYREVEGIPNCKDCLNIVKYCKKIRIK